jgi:hypothetical protein
MTTAYTFVVEDEEGIKTNVDLVFKKSSDISVANLRQAFRVGENEILTVYNTSANKYETVAEEADLGNSLQNLHSTFSKLLRDFKIFNHLYQLNT